MGRLDRAVQNVRAASIVDWDEADNEIAAMHPDELKAAFRSGYLTGIRGEALHSEKVAEMMTEHFTTYAHAVFSLGSNAPEEDLAAITAVNLAMDDWLLTYGLTGRVREALTGIEGQTVARAYLIGLWQHAAPHRGSGLGSRLFSRRRVVRTCTQADAIAQAQQLRRDLLEIGARVAESDTDVADAVAGVVHEHLNGPVHEELVAIQKGLEPDHSRQLEVFYECLEQQLRLFVPGNTATAIMILVEHAAFRALLVGSRLGRTQSPASGC